MYFFYLFINLFIYLCVFRKEYERVVFLSVISSKPVYFMFICVCFFIYDIPIEELYDDFFITL